MNTFYSEFTPYHWYGVNDAALWNSSNPLGAVIAINIAGPDNGSVIVSDYGVNHWTFSTIYDPKYGAHPVSGHRDFGYISHGGGSYTFYTRGVDRLTSWDATAAQWLSDQSGQNIPGPFSQADALWQSFQDKIDAFINANGGSSSVDGPVIHRPDWEKVVDVLNGNAPLSTLSKDCQD